MKLSYWCLIASMFLTVILLGCQQDPEVLEGQAAQALEELSDEELNQ